MPCYVRFKRDGFGEMWGLVEGEDVLILKGSPFAGFEKTKESLSLSSIKEYLPPVDPPNIIAIGLNYEDHAKEAGLKLPDRPVIFLKATTAILPHKRPILLPKEAPDEVDYEAELVVIIGKKAKYVKREEAYEYVLGYTCGNDVSARDCQLRYDKQWARAKSFDTFAPIGPFLVTDIDPSDLKIESRVNGTPLQQSTTRNMIFDVPTLINYLSYQMTLLPGTIIMTGTPSGVGFARRPPIFLRDGDVCEIEIENIGILKNPVQLEV